MKKSIYTILTESINHQKAIVEQLTEELSNALDPTRTIISTNESIEELEKRLTRLEEKLEQLKVEKERLSFFRQSLYYFLRAWGVTEELIDINHPEA